jgi:hypothetical protein
MRDFDSLETIIAKAVTVQIAGTMGSDAAGGALQGAAALLRVTHSMCATRPFAAG